MWMVSLLRGRQRITPVVTTNNTASTKTPNQSREARGGFRCVDCLFENLSKKQTTIVVVVVVISPYNIFQGFQQFCNTLDSW
jgi:hypothetical protein